MAAEPRTIGRPTPDGRERDDGLELPSFRPGLLYAIGAGALVFILVAMALLFGFYQLWLRNAARQPVHAFPEPRLETSIDPRSMPSTPEPGPAPRAVGHKAAEPGLDMDRAMQAVVERGPHAYDPLPAAAPAPGAQP